MIPTEAAAAFHADLLLPLRHANARRGIAYLDRGPRRASYWGEVATRTGGMEVLSGTACDGAHLLRLLGDYWRRQHEPSLPQLLPHLEALRRELTGAREADGEAEPKLTEFVYPLW